MTKKGTILLLTSLIVIGVVIAVSAVLFWDDAEKTQNSEDAILSANVAEGKKLSKKYCVTCHTYPNPDLLDKKTWVSETLPNMGPRFGIFKHNNTEYPKEKTANLPENIYPDKQMLTHAEWQKILDFYEHEAPEKLPVPERKEIINDNLFFEVRTPKYRSQSPPMVTAIRMDSGNRSVYLSDASNNDFLIFDEDLEFNGSFSLSSPMSDIRITNGSQPGRKNLLTTYVGDLAPSDALIGFIQQVWYNPQTGNGGAGAVIMDSLARPVETQRVDLNQDGNEDYLVSEFGHRTGSLFWLANLGNDNFSDKKTLINTPGCIESHVLDFTGDDLPDIVSLCTQVDQAIYLFENLGDGEFARQKLLQFDIVAGSTSFKLHDFNGDGHLDILYTSGDNADYSIIYKHYHGVYIYLNDGNNNFAKEWFYPMNGAYDAAARDFDRDGDTDIAAIAFFADYDNKPEEGFVYFQNEGDLSFMPYHPPAASNGRWIAMDLRDWTGNGRDDIALANFSLGPTRVKSLIQKKFTEGPHFLLLENHPPGR